MKLNELLKHKTLPYGAAPEAAAPARPKTQLDAKPQAAAPGDLRPALYVLAVGVSKYQNQRICL